MDIFFVISGYLITGLLIFEAETTGTISLARFYARRAKRLLPAASLVLLASVVLTYLWGPPLQRSEFGLDVVAAASYVVNWRFAARSVDYLAEDIGRSPVLHFWSLAVEEQFYFVWPILILLVLLLWKASSKRFSLQSALAIALALVLVPSFCWSVHHTSESPTEAFFETSTRLWELSVGAMLAVVSPKLKGVLPQGLSTPLTVVGAVLLVIAAFGFGGDTSWPGYYALAPTLGTALIIAGGAVSRYGIGYKALSFRPLVWVGGMSYPLYLWHWPLLVLGIDWLALEAEKWGGVLVAASVLPAWLSRRFVENPLRGARSLSHRPGYALSIGGNLSLVSIVAGLILTFAAIGGGATEQGENVELQVRKGAVHATPKAMGAGALGSNPKKAPAGRPQMTYNGMTPNPARATLDMPRSYREGCQAKFDATQPKWCEMGDPKGNVNVVVAGDSKILQYFESLDMVGRALGWKIRVGTKSACAFTAARTRRGKKFYEECAAFRNTILAELSKAPPDLVITSQTSSAGAMSGNETSHEGMVEGLVEVWSKLDSMGIAVIVVLDNPHPPKSVAPVYECLLKHPEDATQCAFRRRSGERGSAQGVQLKASKRFRRAQVVDLTDFICPGDKCAPVIGDVLVYRQGSHLTNTYARSLAPILGKKLKRAYDALHK